MMMRGEYIQPPLPMPEHELTGLPSRPALLAMETRLIVEEPGSHAVLMIDLDGIKGVNDEYGHLEGDAYLINNADIVSAVVRHRRNDSSQPGRRPDIVHPDIVGYGMAGHTGGDEFWVLLHNVDTAEKLLAAKERLQNTLDDHGISASIGAVLHSDETTAEEIFDKADAAMYEDKLERTAGRYDENQLQAILQIGMLSVQNNIVIRDIPNALKAMEEIAERNNIPITEVPAYLQRRHIQTA